jgi:hypothetical protein
MSWGLMQVMGQVAREHSHPGPDSAATSAAPRRSDSEGGSALVGFTLSDSHALSLLCDPATGLEIGCRVLAAKLAASHGDVTRALLLWNGGGNPSYATEVLARMPRYR